MLRKHLQIIILVLLIVGSSLAGDKIKLKLHQPPPNKMPVSSLWAMDIENTTKEDVTIYLFGTVNGDRQGEIVGGTSKTFNVKPGKKTYGYEDFKSGEVKWVNKSIQEIIIRTGEVPEDNYTICVSAFYEDGNVAEQQQCIMQLIVKGSEGIITLVSPSENEELKSENPINFMWTATGLKGPYTLTIKEIKKGQTNEQAMAENRVFFEKKDIKTTNYQYGLNDPKLEAGKKYVWGIGDSKSIFNGYSVFVLDHREHMNCKGGKEVYKNGESAGCLYLTGWPNASGNPVHANDGPGYFYPHGTGSSQDILNGDWCEYYFPGSYGQFSHALDIDFSCVGCKTQPNNLVAWYPMDDVYNVNWSNYYHSGGSVDLKDPDQNFAPLIGGILTTCGKVYNSLTFNGSSSYLESNYPPTSIDFATGKSFSIAFWIKLADDNSGGHNVILDKRELSGDSYKGYHIMFNRLTGTGNVDFTIQLADGVSGSSYTNLTFPTVNLETKWHHIVFTVLRSTSEQSNCKLYVDNVLKESIQHYKTGDLTNNSTLVIGARRYRVGNDMEPPEAFFHGSLDELQFYDIDLGINDIKTIYDAGVFGLCKP